MQQTARTPNVCPTLEKCSEPTSMVPVVLKAVAPAVAQAPSLASIVLRRVLSDVFTRRRKIWKENEKKRVHLAKDVKGRKEGWGERMIMSTSVQ